VVGTENTQSLFVSFAGRPTDMAPYLQVPYRTTNSNRVFGLSNEESINTVVLRCRISLN
jgi:hypothetical protein